MFTLSDVFSYLFDMGKDVLQAALDPTTKIIQAQLGDSTHPFTSSNQAEWWQHTGFASMPAPPTQGGPSCQVLMIKRSDFDIVFASRDTRAAAMYGTLKPGECAIFGTVGQGRVLIKQNGAVVAFTTSDNTTSGQSQTMYHGPDGWRVVNQFGS